VGWTKGLELAKLARAKEGQDFRLCNGLHKARALTKQEFRREIEKELTGKDCEPWELIYFRLYKSRISVVDQAIETAALVLGSDKSRGHCLETICADLLAGASLDGTRPEVAANRRRFDSDQRTMQNSANKYYIEIAGDVSSAVL
jgi:hypothetical protein